MRRLWPISFVILAVGLLGCVPEEPSPPAKDEIAPLIAQLGDRDFRTREKATRELIAKGWDAVPAVEKALEKATEPEVAERLEKVLTAISKLSWYAKADEAITAAKKSGRPILLFSTIGDPDGFA